MAARSDAPQATRTSPAGRVPPHDLQAEESLLGAMMLSSTAIADAAGVVTASDFYKPAHGHVYAAVHPPYARSEERRVGQKWGSTGGSRGSPCIVKKKPQDIK